MALPDVLIRVPPGLAVQRLAESMALKGEPGVAGSSLVRSSGPSRMSTSTPRAPGTGSARRCPPRPAAARGIKRARGGDRRRRPLPPHPAPDRGQRRRGLLLHRSVTRIHGRERDRNHPRELATGETPIPSPGPRSRRWRREGTGGATATLNVARTSRSLYRPEPSGRPSVAHPYSAGPPGPNPGQLAGGIPGLRAPVRGSCRSREGRPGRSRPNRVLVSHPRLVALVVDPGEAGGRARTVVSPRSGRHAR